MRKSLDETWRFLASAGETTPRRADGQPLVPDAMPSHNDPAGRIGFSYFKYRLEDADNGDLTLPRTFFGRSYFARVRFANTDLTESRMCWNTFDDCDFSRADLSGCDMRASIFRRCRFVGAVLRRADLRRATFEDCDFTGAELAGAVVEDADFDGCVHDFLSDEQQVALALTDD